MNLMNVIRDALLKGDKKAVELAVSVMGRATVGTLTDAEVETIVELKKAAKKSS